MPFVPVANVIKLAISGTYATMPWANVLHFQYSGGPPSNTTLNSASAIFLNEWQTYIAPHSNAAVVASKVVITDLSSATGSQGENLGNVPGTAAGVALPAHTCFLIQKAINRRYRGGHPRAYLPVGSTGSLANSNSWTGAFQTAVTNDYASLISKTANGGMWAGAGSEVTVHRKLNDEVLTIPLVDIVQSYTGSPEVASQRRRIGRK